MHHLPCSTTVSRMIKTQTLTYLVLMALTLLPSLADARRSGSAREQNIDMVVIHSTGGPTCDGNTGKPVWIGAGTLTANIRQIEADRNLGIHYMIDRDGTLRASVPEDQIAHHVFHYSGRSISIELINNGDGLDPFPDSQLAVLVNLLRDIKQRRGILRNGIKRHSDLDRAYMHCDKSQRRKVDPGAAFPYNAILDQVYSPK